MNPASLDMTTEHNVTETLAEFALKAEFERLPRQVVTVAKQCVLDWLGCTLAGTKDPFAKILLEEISEQGGNKQASVVGTNVRCTLQQAALVNGALSHVLDYDDVHLDMPGHPSAPVVPAALALTELTNATGADFITAVAVAIEVECRIGRLMGPTHYSHGWNPSGTIGTFGATVAAARLMHLSIKQLLHALGLAGTQAAGLQSMIKTQAMTFHSGRAASSGVLAASLAAKGMTANNQVLDCAQGFAATQSQAVNPSAALQGLNKEWRILDTIFKHHVCCFGAHPALEATYSSVREHDLAPGDILSVDAYVSTFINKLCNVTDPQTVPEMKFCIPLNLAMTLTGVDTGDVDSYSLEQITRPEIARTKNLVQMHHEPTFPDWQSDVDIHLKDGTTLHGTANLAEANRDLADQDQRLSSKFLNLAGSTLGKSSAAKALDLLRCIEELPDLKTLMALSTFEKEFQ